MHIKILDQIEIKHIQNRIRSTNSNLQSFVKKRVTHDIDDTALICETIATSRAIEEMKLPPQQLCSQLRAHAINTQDYSPVISAFMEVMAADFQTLQQKELTQ